MIFITVGTTDFPFDRVDELVLAMASKFPKETVIYQSKSTNVHSSINLKIFKELKYPIFLKYIKGARVIITHGGPATIFLALTKGKSKPFVLPRKKILNEHVSDHQIHFARFMARKNLVKIADEKKDVLSQLAKYCRNPEKNDYKSDSKRLIGLVTKLKANIEGK